MHENYEHGGRCDTETLWKLSYAKSCSSDEKNKFILPMVMQGSSSRASLSLDVTTTTTSDDSLALPVHDLSARPLSSAVAPAVGNSSLR
jgi:hypothetical protein